MKQKFILTLELDKEAAARLEKLWLDKEPGFMAFCKERGIESLSLRAPENKNVMSNKITIYTDGGCHGNPGPGAWGFIVIYENGEKATEEQTGGEVMTTNNRMELLGAINALKFVDPATPIEFFTDSQYVKNGITTWIKNWKRNGWKTAAKEPVKNQALWIELDSLVVGRDINWNWVKGHAGDEFNERCDFLVQSKISEIENSII